MLESMLLAAKQIPGDQFFLTNWISVLFGIIIDFIFNIVHTITVPNSLGISLILLTLVARVLMIPIAIKQQKSMLMTNKMSPEMKKIQDKYAGRTNDPEVAKKMQMETQKLYDKYNFNPMSGCLPALIQLPIFIGLYYVMQYPSLFIGEIGSLYAQVGDFMNSLSNDVLNSTGLGAVIMEKLTDTNVDIVQLLPKILAVFTKSDWDLVSQVAQQQGNGGVVETISQIEAIVTFCGINLTENVSDNIMNFMNFKFMIPLISGVSTFLSSWLMTKKSAAVSEQAKAQQRTMTVIMPFFMAFITLNLPCGVGVYWITSNIFQIAQQVIINKVYTLDDLDKGGKKK